MTTSLIQQLNTVSLYERLGAAAGIRRLVDGMVEAHLRNPVIQARFERYIDRPERVEEIKQHTCAFIAVHSGGPGSYNGRSMEEAHRGMNIKAAEYLAAIGDVLDTMKAQGHDHESRTEVLGILRALKPEIAQV